MDSVNLTFQDKVKLSKGGVHLLDFSAINSLGIRMWYIVVMKHEQYLKFMEATNDGNPDVDISKYGEILASGVGNSPSIEEKKAAEDKYKSAIK